jgi:putative nucleotidyltransferase with HDIG domain
MIGERLEAATAALLAALKMRDEGTHDHSRRVMRVAVLIGELLGLGRQELVDLAYGALLHDIGKIGTRECVLKKAGPHTEAERRHMREHVAIGVDMLICLGMPASVTFIVGQHHERWDGMGYPFGFKGERISLGARICAVADAYDAITQTRCYRHGLSYQAAASALTRGSGSQFDADVVQAFFKVSEVQLAKVNR